MSDLRALADEAIHHLDRLGAIILNDVGDGPRPSDLAAAASAARDAVARLAVPALTQLTGLVAGVADSLAGGVTEWNPSLGGTMIAAVDDLRHLAARASQFSDEDSEHLHHRAAELSAYVSAPPSVIPSAPAPVILSEAKDLLVEKAKADPSAAPRDDKAAAPTVDKAAAPGDDNRPRDDTKVDSMIVPIDQLFYADGGPHIVSGVLPREAASKSDLLGRGIDALDNLTARPIAKRISFGAMEVVPVESLLYRGRAALERAAALREQIKASGAAASPATLDEMYDLIGLALKD